MRRWFELGELADTTYASKEGDIQWLQLPQKAEFIKWANQLVGLSARLTRGSGDPTICFGIGDGSAGHVIVPDSAVTVVQVSGELRGQMLFQGVPPVFQGLCRQYFEKPGEFDGPNESQTVEKPRGGTTKGGGSGTFKISLLSYLLLLLNTWQTGATGLVPQRWIEWLTLLISHYGRYTPTQIYGFLGRVDFSAATFKV